MLFQITINDASGSTILKDAFQMESVTLLVDFSSGLLKRLKNSTLEHTYELSIFSEEDCHVFHRFDSVDGVMLFKNAFYEYLIELNDIPSPNIQNFNNFTNTIKP